LGGFGIHLKFLGDVGLSLGEWRRGMEKEIWYFVCDFNKRWLKDSNFLCCTNVQLSVEGGIV
jgi:hypothetical protein